MSLLTPSFAASQDHDQVRILIHLSQSHLGHHGFQALVSGPQASDDAPSSPSSSCSLIGVVAQGNIFGFRCTPYYLPLVFPGDLAATPSPSWRFAERSQDGADLVVEVTLTKEHSGEEFIGLDELQAQYLPDLGGAGPSASSSSSFAAPGPSGFAGGSASREEETGLINQMLGRAMAKEGLMDEGGAGDEAMTAPSKDGITAVHAQASLSNSSVSSSEKKSSRPPRLPIVPLGTRSRCHKLFLTPAKVASSSSFATDGPLLDEAETQYRTGFSERMEDEKWDEAWYLDNYVDESGEVAEVLGWRDPSSATMAFPSHGGSSALEGLGSDVGKLQLLLVLVEILYAGAYDRRTTMGDASVESGWTMAMLCRSLVCSCPPFISPEADVGAKAALEATMRASYRRSLSMPLYRHWSLSRQVHDDVVQTLSGGKSAVLQALADVATALGNAVEEDHAMGVYLEHLVAPLEAWVRGSVEEESLVSLSQASQSVELTKEQVGGETWDLEALEEAAREALEEQRQQQ